MGGSDLSDKSARQPVPRSPAAWPHDSARLFFGVALPVFLSRLPFLGAGFGSDPDAWRMALSGHALAATGRYGASRLPGNPVPEIADALLVRGGPLAVNGATALWSAVACGAFALALRRSGVRSPALTALALAATPIVYVNSVNAMDYAWALAFILMSWAAAVAGRASWSGFLIGVATGCRLSSALLALPILIFLEAATGRDAGARVRFILAAAITTGVALLPLFLAHGTGFLQVYEFGSISALYVLKGATVDVWGLPGSVAVAIGMAIGLARLARGETRIPRAESVALALAILGSVLLYLRLPHEGAYLMPAVPFVLLFLARALPDRAFVAVCVALLLSPFAFKVSEPGKADAPSPSAAARVVRAGGRAFLIDPRGPVLWDHERRKAGLAYRQRVLGRIAALPSGSVVVAQEWMPVLRWGHEPADTAHVRFVHLLDRESAASLVAAGRPIYYLPQAAGPNRAVFGVDLDAIGARPLLDEDRP